MITFYSVRSKRDIGSGYEDSIASFQNSEKVPIPVVGDKAYVNDVQYKVIEVTISYNEKEPNDVYVEVYVVPYCFLEDWLDD